MLELSPLSLKERLWSAGAIAFVMHGLVISSLALTLQLNGSNKPQTQVHELAVEMLFYPKTEGNMVPEDESIPVMKTAFIKKPRKNIETKRKQEDKNLSLQSPSLYGENHSIPIYNPAPEYPREARRKKIEGVVLVRASLSSSGTVSEATTLPPRIDPLLETAALTAIRQWRFQPGVRIVDVPIEFKLVT